MAIGGVGGYNSRPPVFGASTSTAPKPKSLGIGGQTTGGSTGLPIPSGGSGGYVPPPMSMGLPGGGNGQASGPSLNLNAQANPLMMQNYQQQQDRAKQYQNGMTTEANAISGNVADMFAGRENSISQQAAQMGANGMQAKLTAGNAQQRITAGEQTNAMLGREREYNRMLEAQGGAAGRIAGQQTTDNQLGLNAYTAQHNANMGVANSAFDQQMALLNAQRSSQMNPIYWG